MTKNTQHL